MKASDKWIIINPKLKGMVWLCALDCKNIVVEDLTIPYEKYYGGDNKLVDSAAYRRQNGVRFLNGRIYDMDGKLAQEFLNKYSEHGEYLSGRAEFSNGIVQED